MAVRFLRFEDIKAWRMADELALDIYRIFRPINDYGFKDQIQRAAVSIMNNIAEGFERDSRRSFVYHLQVSKGSCGEVRSMLFLGFQLGYLSETDFQRLTSNAMEISRLLYGLIQDLRH